MRNRDLVLVVSWGGGVGGWAGGRVTFNAVP